jgi:hypothetical protein
MREREIIISLRLPATPRKRWLVAAATALLGVGVLAYAAAPNTFSSGQVLSSAQLNANFASSGYLATLTDGPASVSSSTGATSPTTLPNWAALQWTPPGTPPVYKTYLLHVHVMGVYDSTIGNGVGTSQDVTAFTLLVGTTAFSAPDSRIFYYASDTGVRKDTSFDVVVPATAWSTSGPTSIALQWNSNAGTTVMVWDTLSHATIDIFG